MQRATVQALREAMQKQLADHDEIIRLVQAKTRAELKQLHLTIQELRDRIEKLQGERALEELEVATAEWEGMPALDDEAAHEELTRRFERAVRAALQSRSPSASPQHTGSRCAVY